MTAKILFFIAGSVPTVDEQAQIDALNALTQPGYEVGVRTSAQSPNYGAGIEDCDLVAGDIPDAYSEITDYGTAHADRPLLINMLPATHSLAASATKQLQVIKVDGTSASDLSLSDVTAVTTTYASSNEAKATVSAGGLVTGVAAGTATITATHTYATGKTITTTSAITVTA